VVGGGGGGVLGFEGCGLARGLLVANEAAGSCAPDGEDL